MKTNDLIEELSNKGLAERKPLMTPMKFTCIWIGVMITYVIIISAIIGVREDLIYKLQDLIWTLEILFLLSLAISATFAANCLALPDVNQNKHIMLFPVLHSGLFCIMLIIQYFRNMELAFFDYAAHCSVHLMLYSVVPIILMFALLKRAAAIHKGKAGFMISISVTSFGYLILRLVENTDNILHLLLWHLAPMLLVSTISIFIGQRLLRW
jgi:hypothetical protein